MARRTHPARYPIRAVAKMTGLSIDTLAAWERRHKAGIPTRDHRGRMYTDADVQRLRLLRDALERGHAIGRATRLTNIELEEINVPGAHEKAATSAGSDFNRDAMAEALSRFDQPALRMLLGRAAVLLSPAQFVSDVALPLLNEVGARVRHEGAGAADAHLAESAIRFVLGSMLHQYAGGGGARVLFASLDDGRHEFGILGAAVVAAGGGLDVVYLGAGIAADDLVSAARRSEADVLVVGVNDTVIRDRAVRELSSVVRGLSPDVEIWVHGAAGESIASQVGARVQNLETFGELAAHLTRVGARLTSSASED